MEREEALLAESQVKTVWLDWLGPVLSVLVVEGGG